MGIIIRNLRQRWPGGCVPFKVDKKNLDEKREQAVTDAIDEWERAGFRFVERDMHENFVTFAELDPDPDAAGNSWVGMIGGEQFVRLDDGKEGGATKGTVIHEIGHAVGLAHEQQRSDRNDHISVHRENFSSSDTVFDTNYGRLDNTAYARVGAYDLCSIMHYPTNFNSDQNVITVDDPSEQCAQTVGQRSGLSAGDIASASALLDGRGEVCQMSGSGQFQNTVAQIDFSSGWNVLASYVILGVQYVLLLKTRNGRVRVRRVEGDGSLSDPIFDDDWTKGWTHAVPYSVGSSNWLLLYKSGTGDLHLHELKLDGRIGKRIADRRIEKGFTSVLAYNILLGNYMLFLKSSNGIVKINHIDWNGLLGSELETHDWTGGWTSALTYKVGLDNFLFLLKEDSGLVHIHQLTSEGKVGRKIAHNNLHNGFTHAIWLPISLSNYVLLSDQNSGLVQIVRIEGNGHLGTRSDLRRFRKGISAFVTYGAWAGRYLLMMRA